MTPHHRRTAASLSRGLRRLAPLAALLAFGVMVVAFGTGAAPARAQERHWQGDIHHFHEHDFERWRGGRWVHATHGGRLGWWWIVGGTWYFYPAPIYPYPDPYAPPVVTAPVAPLPPPPPPPAQYYYCDNPQGYYPYVPSCRTPWRTVPSQP